MKLILGAGLLSLTVVARTAAQVPAGPEFGINSHTTSRQASARLAMAPNGDFVVVWASDGQDGDGYGVFGQRFASSGAPRGGEFQINTYTTGPQGGPAVAVGSRGDFVVVWGSGSGAAAAEIKGQLFDAAGATVGGEFQLNASTGGFVYGPRAARAPDGSFVAVWMGSDGAGTGIVARRFDSAGNALTNEFVVNTFTPDYQGHGDIAFDSNGGFVIAWGDAVFYGQCGWACDISAQRFDASGNRLGAEFKVNSSTTGNQTNPSVSVSPAGEFVVAWYEWSDGSSGGIFARRFGASGAALGNDFVVNATTIGSQWGGDVAHDARGNFVITWTGQDVGAEGIFGQRFLASGSPRGSEFRLNAYTTGRQFEPALASDQVGNFAVAWNSADQDGSGFGVFGQRFGGLRPAGLNVDTPGNRVLEPGETVAIQPSWTNFSSTGRVFGGTLSDIAGPSGAVYAITDGFADYGLVADGATAACADCYAVSVSNPPARPAPHWDASAVESLVPDVQGQQKTWRLHIGASFDDVATTGTFYRFIEALVHHGVTGGCGATDYCPAGATARQQMAVFVLLAKEGPGYVPPACGATPMFADVPPSSPYCRWVEEVARRGVAGGCGGAQYCPLAAVTREQMAVFVLRVLDPALSPPACTAPMFSDVPAASPFCPWIEELARRGVVTGCGTGQYCPASPVTREQMSVFLAVAFALALYGS